MRKHTIWQNGRQEDVPFTPEEEAAADEESAKFKLEQSMKDWLIEMKASDVVMSRIQEDFIDHLIKDHYGSVNDTLKARSVKKKEIRSRRPKA